MMEFVSVTQVVAVKEFLAVKEVSMLACAPHLLKGMNTRGHLLLTTSMYIQIELW